MVVEMPPMVAPFAYVIYNLGATWSAGGDCNTNMDRQCPGKSNLSRAQRLEYSTGI